MTHLDHDTIQSAMYRCASKAERCHKPREWAARFAVAWADNLAHWSGTQIAAVLDAWVPGEKPPNLAALTSVLGGLTRHAHAEPLGCAHCDGGIRQGHQWPRTLTRLTGDDGQPYERWGDEQSHGYQLACDCRDGQRYLAQFGDWRTVADRWTREGHRYWIQDADNPFLGGMDVLAQQDRERLERAKSPNLGKGRELRPKLAGKLTYGGAK